MMKSGDVLVIDERVFEEGLGLVPYPDVRAAKVAAKARVEEGSGNETLLIVRVERVARPKAKKPAFDVEWDAED